MRSGKHYFDSYKRLIDDFGYYITEEDFYEALNNARKEAIEESSEVAIGTGEFEIGKSIKDLIKELK